MYRSHAKTRANGAAPQSETTDLQDSDTTTTDIIAEHRHRLHKWNAELAEWRARPLDDLEVVYMWVDGVYVKAGLEREKAAILVVMAALSDGSQVVVSAVPGYRESTRSWSEVLRDLSDRGLNCPRLVVGDGHLGIWGALRNVWPQAGEQRCWNHKILNLLGSVPSAVMAVM